MNHRAFKLEMTEAGAECLEVAPRQVGKKRAMGWFPMGEALPKSQCGPRKTPRKKNGHVWLLKFLGFLASKETTSPWQVLKSPFIYCFQATGKALRPTAPRWKSLSEATPEPAHIVRCTGKIILLYIYIYILVRLLLPRLSHLPAQIMIQQNSMG